MAAMTTTMKIMTTLNEKYEREAAAQEAALNAIGGYDEYNRHIWEGWTVGDFIEELKPELDLIMTGQSTYKPFKNKRDLAKWCADNQPYYKLEIPEVVTYFSVLYGIGRGKRNLRR